MLGRTGINITIFKPHSISATTSKTKSLGLITKDVLQKGSWSGKSTWEKSYNKKIKQSEHAFQESIF